jgi:hypothetical protein
VRRSHASAFARTLPPRAKTIPQRGGNSIPRAKQAVAGARYAFRGGSARCTGRIRPVNALGTTLGGGGSNEQIQWILGDEDVKNFGWKIIALAHINGIKEEAEPLMQALTEPDAASPSREPSP